MELERDLDLQEFREGFPLITQIRFSLFALMRHCVSLPAKSALHLIREICGNNFFKKEEVVGSTTSISLFADNDKSERYILKGVTDA